MRNCLLHLPVFAILLTCRDAFVLTDLNLFGGSAGWALFHMGWAHLCQCNHSQANGAGFFLCRSLSYFPKKIYRLIIFWLVFSRPEMPAAAGMPAAPVVATHSLLPPAPLQYVPNARFFFGVFICSKFIFLYFFLKFSPGGYARC